MTETTRVRGLTISFRRAGRGDSVLFLHGSPGDSRTWGPQIRGLADEFTVIAWDMPGFGGSDDPPETFTLADYADCAAGFVTALGLESVDVVGLSFGGGLALQLYDRYPTIPRSLTLVGAYAGWAGSLPADVFEQRRKLYHRLAEMTPEEFVGELLPTMFTSSPPAEAVDEFGEAILGTHPSALRVTATAFATADLRDVLSRVRVPTLLVYGDEDIRAPLYVADAMHSGIRGSKLVVVEGVGHVVNVEAPDRFNAELREFLRWSRTAPR